MRPCQSRRQFLRAAGAAVLTSCAAPALPTAASDSSARVSIARARSYDPAALLGALTTMADQIGGLAGLVGGKTVAVKVNLTGDVHQEALGLPAGRSYHTHPALVLATAALLERAGARRVRFLETTYQLGPFEAYLKDAGWDMAALAAMRIPVEFEDTRNLGQGRRYAEVKVPWGGSLFPAYHLNHSYVDCDVYVSLAKLKNHGVAGVTLGIKNNFGVTPTALYSSHEANERSTSARVAMFHTGEEKPPEGLPAEVDPKAPRRISYRVPRHTIDALGIRPIHLTIIDGIETMSGGEGPWLTDLAVQRPGLLLMGRNPVCTDSVATAVMGYDPAAPSATGPFAGDNHLAMAAALGLGTNDLKRIEVVGLSIDAARHPFVWQPRERNT